MNPWLSCKTFVCHWSISLGPNSNGYSCSHPRPENSPPTRFFFRYNTFFYFVILRVPFGSLSRRIPYARDVRALVSRSRLRCTFVFPKRFNLHVSTRWIPTAETLRSRLKPALREGRGTNPAGVRPRRAHLYPPQTFRGFRLVIGESLWPFTGDNLITIRVRTLFLTMTTRMQTGFRKRRQNYNNFNFNLVFYSWIGVKMSAVTGRQITISVYDKINCHPSWRVSIIRKGVDRPNAYARI